MVYQPILGVDNTVLISTVFFYAVLRILRLMMSYPIVNPSYRFMAFNIHPIHSNVLGEFHTLKIGLLAPKAQQQYCRFSFFRSTAPPRPAVTDQPPSGGHQLCCWPCSPFQILLRCSCVPLPMPLLQHTQCYMSV